MANSLSWYMAIAYTVVAYIVMAKIVMAYIVMAKKSCGLAQRWRAA